MNAPAFFLQAFVSSRLIRYKGLRGVLLALPLVALGGYSTIAAGAGLSFVLCLPGRLKIAYAHGQPIADSGEILGHEPLQ